LFLIVAVLLFILMTIWGLATMVLLLLYQDDVSEGVKTRLIAAFASMFTGFLGFAVGYIAGRGGES